MVVTDVVVDNVVITGVVTVDADVIMGDTAFHLACTAGGRANAERAGAHSRIRAHTHTRMLVPFPL